MSLADASGYFLLSRRYHDNLTMPNRLANELSPYLLQHKDNPVDWYPWGPEALARAKDEQKPIFLSIGYSACHWCHVMEHESFESETIAETLNEHFISIKVDREERPDLDQIYMQAVQMMTGRGGWPMSVFLTPELEPFYGGTYFPPTAKMGMPGFDDLLRGILDVWQNRRSEAVNQGGRLAEAIREQSKTEPSSVEGLTTELLHNAVAQLERAFDFTYGGFGQAPKFPHPMDLRLLMRFYSRDRRDGVLDMLRLTLDKMAHSGMYDQLGGGFHRYSVDARWLVPHFEKMLYDNALLARVYAEAFQLLGDEEYARVTRETLDYVLREMQGEHGGFFSTQDADSEGVEGKFFVWSVSEVHEVLGKELGDVFCRVYDVTDGGNFEGTNILNLPKTIGQCAALMERDEAELREQLAAARSKLFDVRKERIHPGLDDKVLVGWNGLMIETMAIAAGALDEPRYLAAAESAAEFVWNNMRREDGRLLHTFRTGEARLDAYLDDYAALAEAMISLYEATFKETYLKRAIELADAMLTHFHDKHAGGFFYTADDHEQLIARQKDVIDNAVPSGSSLAAGALLRLGKLTPRSEYLEAAENTLQATAAQMQQMPMALGQMLLALDDYLGPTHELALLADATNPTTAELLAELRKSYLSRRVVTCRSQAVVEGGNAALDAMFAGKEAQGEEPTLYICEGFACQEPVAGKEAIKVALEKLAASVKDK